jgi:hypothetical protein
MIERIPDMRSRSTTGAGNSTTATDRKALLSTLWIFAVLNYIYADVFTAMDPFPESGSVRMSRGMMLGAAALMETAMVMVLLSRFLKYRANRWANIVVGVMHTLAVIVSILVGGVMPASYYLFFASVEVVSTSFIVWYAWKWRNVEIS